MNPEVKALFVAELKSGKYVPLEGALRPKGKDIIHSDEIRAYADAPQNGRCCLGVLEELAVEHGVRQTFPNKVLTSHLTYDTAKWAELTHYEGSNLASLNDHECTNARRENRPATYQPVIDHIERHL